MSKKFEQLKSWQKTCGFSALTTRAERLARLRGAGLKPATLPILAFLQTRPPKKGTAAALICADVCMLAAVIGKIC